jgi:hypothetical protein
MEKQDLPGRTVASETVYEVLACSSILTRRRLAFVNIFITVFSFIPRLTEAVVIPGNPPIGDYNKILSELVKPC